MEKLTREWTRMEVGPTLCGALTADAIGANAVSILLPNDQTLALLAALCAILGSSGISPYLASILKNS